MGRVLQLVDRLWQSLGHLPICEMGSNMNQQCARSDEGEADHIRKTRSERGIQDHFQAAEVPQHGILEGEEYKT